MKYVITYWANGQWNYLNIKSLNHYKTTRSMDSFAKRKLRGLNIPDVEAIISRQEYSIEQFDWMEAK